MQANTPERKYIAFFGVRNAGKSSLVNAVTGQMLSVVSDVKGTTTDPVYKTMELLPIGPVMIIDTPGIDDVGPLGELRSARAKETLRRTDIAILVVSAAEGLQKADLDLIALFREREIPYLIVMNKIDLLPEDSRAGIPEATLQAALQAVPGSAAPDPAASAAKSDSADSEALAQTDAENPAGAAPDLSDSVACVSALTGEGIWELKEKIGKLSRRAGKDDRENLLVEDLVDAGDLVVLVTPIDESAPKGRLILPQQMVIRAVLDRNAIPVVTKENTYAETLRSLGRQPRIVITDSQVFGLISELTPREIPLTSFSILMARYKGILADAYNGAQMVEKLRDGDRVLIAEGCTHHRQCNDIGTVKLPNLIRRASGSEPEFSFTSGRTFPEDLTPYRLIVHCGGCMLNEQEMRTRNKEAKAAGVPMTNYGILLAKLNGILERCTEMLD